MMSLLETLCSGASFLQWYQGKSYRTFCLRACSLSAGETEAINVLANLEIKLWVNGEARQSASSSQFDFQTRGDSNSAVKKSLTSRRRSAVTGTPGALPARLSQTHRNTETNSWRHVRPMPSQ